MAAERDDKPQPASQFTAMAWGDRITDEQLDELLARAEKCQTVLLRIDQAAWVVLLRVTPTSRWCAYGPATQREAIAFRQRSVGAGMVRELAQLIPLPGAGAKAGDARTP